MLIRFGRHVRSQLVGYFALFVALGGVSYAAVALPKNSVGSRQIKNGQVKHTDIAKNAVTSVNVKDGSLLSADFKPGQLVAGAPGPQGPAGVQGPKGDTGAPGAPGANGADFTTATTLGSGQTLTGQWSISGGAPPSTYVNDAVTFRIPLHAGIPAANTHYVPDGGTTAPCTGTAAAPTAPAGHLCIYNSYGGPYSFYGVLEGEGPAGTSTSGFTIYLETTGSSADLYGTRGTWALKTP